MGFIREDKTNGNNNDNNVIKTISSKVLATVPASNITLDDEIAVNNISINKDRRYYIEFLGTKKLCSLLISDEIGDFIICSIGNYSIEIHNNTFNISIYIDKINTSDTTDTFTDLIIYEEEVKYLDNKYLETDLVLQNSVSLGRIGDMGAGSSAIGYDVEASGYASHAEGSYTQASGGASHAEGYRTAASGKNSHAEGTYTIASGENQHAQGRYNIVDNNNKYAHIVGNGNSSTDSNAHTLDWEGNGWYAGKLSQEGTPTEDKDLVTKKYVDDNTVIHPLPIYKMAEAPTMITYTVNIMDLKKLTTYGAIRDINSTKYQRYHFIYPCDDGTNKTIVNTGDDINDTTFRVYHYDNSSTLTFNNVRYSIDYTKHSTSTDVIVTEYIQNYLGIYNTREYTPTEDYNPATKKYVDDSKQIKYISPTNLNELVELTKEDGLYYITQMFEINYDSTAYPVSKLYDVRKSNQQTLYYGYNDMQMFYVDANNTVTTYQNVSELIQDLAPNDLSLNSTTNSLQLVNSQGEKIGAGITLPTPKISDTLVTTPTTSNTLTLTKDKYQTATVADGTEITLPTVTSFTKIHLLFSTTADLTLTLPTCKWQNGNIPTISANKTYEFIFTYTTEWLGVVIVYG